MLPVTREATSLTGKRSKLIAIVLVVVVLGAGVGYWLLAPRMPSGLVTYTTQETSLLTSSEQTHLTSTLSAALTSETTQWINVSTAQPVSYYLKLLESNRTEAYVQLANELRKLPDLKNVSAVAKITYLALNATNPEVKEAFELMIKGGTPDPKDFQYGVPRYNTELQVLYWLALQNEFKKDDTLALSISMVHGLWVTMGNEQVKQAVRNDSTQLLRYFRETNELQKQRGYYQLENYPIEAKICLAWTGNVTPIIYSRSFDRYSKSRIPIDDYLWDTVSVRTLRRMRSMMTDRQWIQRDVGRTTSNLEYFFYFAKGVAKSDHWDFTLGRDEKILVDEKLVLNKNIQNVDWLFEYFLNNDKGTGVCTDEAAFVDAFDKSFGIATTFAERQTIVPPEQIPPGMSTDGHAVGHAYVSYFDPSTLSWRADEKQSDVDSYWSSNVSYLHFLKPPLRQYGYIVRWNDGKFWGGGMYYTIPNTTIRDVKLMLMNGIPTSQMKQWLLYG